MFKAYIKRRISRRQFFISTKFQMKNHLWNKKYLRKKARIESQSTVSREVMNK